MLKNNLKIWLLSSLVMTTATDAMSAKISIPDFTIEPGEQVTVAVSLDNDGKPTFAYSGWQFDLFVPEGLSVGDFGLDQALTSGDFKLSLTDYGGGISRVLAFTTSTGVMSSDMLSLSFRADEDAPAGELTLLMKHAIFSTPEGKDIDLDDSQVTVTVKAMEEPVAPKAETPLQLLRKGDGTSHTFVCMMPLTNEELVQLGYHFIYGYSDSTSGTSHVLDDTPLRYCHTSEEIFDDANLDFWVFAYFTDSEGTMRVSDRRHLDGSADDNFDPKDYIGKSTKADSDAAITGVYTPDGRKVADDIKALAKGIYVVRTTEGSFKIMK